MRFRIFRVAAILLLFAASSARMLPAQRASRKDLEEELQRFRLFYGNSLKDHGIVGSSFFFVHDNQVLAREFYGLAHLEQRRRVDENTIYHWASITKTFTGIAIMQLRDRGLLKLDDPITKYLPELKAVHDPYGDTTEITIRHLMTHSAGFRNATWPWKDPTKHWQPHEPQHWEQLVAMLPYTEVLFKPGSKFSYSNPGVVFLGRIIHLLTLDDYEVYVDKNILKPLEMYRSYFDTAPYHLEKDLCQSYFLKEGRTTPARWNLNTGITVSNGGLNAPLTDMAKYLSFLMGDPRKQALYDQILKRSSLEEMFQPQVEVSKAPNDRIDLGLIFFIEEHNGMLFVAHSGGQNAFISHFYLNPRSRTAFLVAYNTESDDEGKQTRLFDKNIAAYTFQHLFPLFNQ